MLVTELGVSKSLQISETKVVANGNRNVCVTLKVLNESKADVALF